MSPETITTTIFVPAEAQAPEVAPLASICAEPLNLAAAGVTVVVCKKSSQQCPTPSYCRMIGECNYKG